MLFTSCFMVQFLLKFFSRRMASHRPKGKKSLTNLLKFSWSGAVTATNAIIIVPVVPDTTAVWLNFASYLQQSYSPGKLHQHTFTANYDQSTATHSLNSSATQRDGKLTSSVKPVLSGSYHDARYDGNDITPPTYEECQPMEPPPPYQSLLSDSRENSS